MAEQKLASKMTAFLINAAGAMGMLSLFRDGLGQAVCIAWFFAATLGALRYAYLLDLKNEEANCADHV